MRFVDYACLFCLGILLALLVAISRPLDGARRIHSLIELAAPREPRSPLVQELPDHLVNAPADRVSGPDGHPLLDHGEGW